MSPVEDAGPAPAAEPHHVTFFAPDRPVGGATVYVVDGRSEAAEPVDHDGLPPR